MKQRLISVLICLVSIVLVYYAVARMEAMQSSTGTPVAQDGFLDLSGYDFSRKESLPLNGEWKFADGLFLTEADIAAGTYDSRTRTVAVPGQRKDYPAREGEPRSFGYGTYFLRISLGEESPKDFAIKTTNIGMSNILFVNGARVGVSGKPSESKSTYVVSNVPYQSFFRADGSYIDIVIWIANYDYSPYGGIVGPVYFGTPQQIIQTSCFSQVIEVIVVSSLFLFALTFLCIYIYRRKALHPLYFGLHCLTGAFVVLTHGEKLLFALLPWMDYLFFARLQYIFPGLNILFYILFLQSFYPELFPDLFSRILLAVGALMIPVGFVAQLSVQSVFSGYQMAFIVTVLLYSVYKLVLGIVRGTQNAVFVGISSLLTLFIALISIENILGKIQLDLVYLCAMLLFGLNQTILLSVRVGESFNMVTNLYEELARQDGRKNEFLAKTSHEFRTPLHGIMNIVGMYVEKEQRFMTEEDLKSMGLVVEISKRLSRLVNDILDADLMQSGKLRLDRTCFPLEQCLGDILDVCRRVYGRCGAQIELSIGAGLPDIYLDRDRLTQIVYNLVDNAMNHTRAGMVRICAAYAQGRTSISISDDGQGIAPEKLKEIFDPYAHFSDTAADGSGIGLSIVKQLTEYMGGTIEVRSKMGEGTTFTLRFGSGPENGRAHNQPGAERLPRRIQNAPSARESAGVAFDTPYVLNQMGEATVLVVDDSFSNLKIIVDALKADRHNLIAVKSGAEMLEAFQNHPEIDLVVLDLLLPDYSGYELCKRLRERKSMVELPVLILTAAINPDDLQHALSLGANDFIHKPYPVNELRARVRSLLYLKRTAMLSAQYEIAFLHAQIKPHFLYNALTAIAALCRPDSREARDLTLSLAKYLRGTLDFDNLENLVSIDKELALVRAYLNIEQVRYPKLKVSVEVDEEINVQLPPMTLQVLVENAVRHGAVKLDGGGGIRLRVRRQEGGILFSVADNGAGIPAGQLEKLLEGQRQEGGIGLYNVNTRLNRHYGHGLRFESPESGGFIVSFIIPGKEGNAC